MTSLEREDIERARRTPPGERGLQAIALMRTGFRLRRAALRVRYPAESEDEIEARFRRWLEGDDRA
jgi:hypothetical protein